MIKNVLKGLILNTEVYSRNSTCINRKVGACIFDPDNEDIISYGTNRIPNKLCSCKDVNEWKRRKLGYQSGEGLEYCRCIHAEVDAILQAAKKGKQCKGMHIYVNTPPCAECVMHIYQAGIECIFCGGDYPEEVKRSGELMANALGINYITLDQIMTENEYRKTMDIIKYISEEGEKNV